MFKSMRLDRAMAPILLSIILSLSLILPAVCGQAASGPAFNAFDEATIDSILLRVEFGKFEVALEQISKGWTERLQEIEVEAEEVRKSVWMQSVQLQAESTFIDGFSLEELYPLCTEQMKGKYYDQAFAGLSTGDFAQVLEDIQSLDYVNLCVLTPS